MIPKILWQETCSGPLVTEIVNGVLRVSCNDGTPPPPAPVAEFTATPLSGIAPLTVQFTDKSTGSITTWAWDFQNNGSTDSTAQNPSYTYGGAGTYSIKLVVTGPGGSSTQLKENHISVEASPPPSGPAYYVASNGNDANPGTLEQPFRTIGYAISVVQAGETVYVRAGTYRERLVIAKSGTASAPITIMAFPSEVPVIEDTRTPPDTHQSYQPYVSIAGSYVVFGGFEVRNSIGRGVQVQSSAQHVTLQSLNVHHSWTAGLTIFGRYTTILGCSIWENCRSDGGDNREKYPNSAGAVDVVGALDVTIRGCNIFNNNGEGIEIMQDAGRVTVGQCVIYDNYQTQVLLDHAHDCLIQRTLIYQTADKYWWRNPDRPAPCIVFSDESMGGQYTQATSYHNMIANNIIMGGGWNISFRTQASVVGGGLKDSLIAHNTLVEGQGDLGGLRIIAGDHRNTRIENNLVLQTTGTVATAPDVPGLAFSHNAWSRPVSAACASPNDVVGDPRLVGAANWPGYQGGEVLPDWFKLAADSPARDAGKVTPEVVEDFFQTPRDGTPDMGAHEYTG